MGNKNRKKNYIKRKNLAKNNKVGLYENRNNLKNENSSYKPDRMKSISRIVLLILTFVLGWILLNINIL